MQTLSGLEQCSVTLPQMRQGSMSVIAIFKQLRLRGDVCRRSRWGYAPVYGWQLVVENDVEK